jgi:hypothetical protein
MSNCETTKSTGVVFQTYGDYRKHKFCQNIYKKNSTCKNNCFIDCSDTLTITTKNNGAGNINIDSKFISMDGSINIISQGVSPGIIFIDGSINAYMNDLSINSVNTFTIDGSDNLKIDCSNQINIESTNVNINTKNTEILSNLLDISGISNINIKNDELNIDISNNSTITISDKSFRFDVSGSNYIVITDICNNNARYILDGSSNPDACTIL